MKVESLIRIINSDFYTGVPDSQLKALCNYLMYMYGIDSQHHIIAANEGNATALAAGYHLATGKIPVVYMQNSGEGNIINPVASLLNEKVYKIPTIFMIGWRGEPGVHDEPQHIYQGEVTLKILDDMNIKYFIIDPDTTEDEVEKCMEDFRKLLANGFCVAFVIRKGALNIKATLEYKNNNTLSREEIIKHIVKVSDKDPIISTTGKASRELFEIRTMNGQDHEMDFLTVGSMGHCSSIALGVALNKPREKVWCIDGDGAVLMHMGALPVIAFHRPQNLIHVVINNGSHETVGGQPTVAGDIVLADVAKACGYPYAVRVSTIKELDTELKRAKEHNALAFIEVLSGIGARKDLGRPTTTALENKEKFMEYLKRNEGYLQSM